MKLNHTLAAALLGLSYSVSGSHDANDASIAYDATQGHSGTGNVISSTVPEPRNWLMVLAGLGLVGVMVERVKRRNI